MPVVTDTPFHANMSRNTVFAQTAVSTIKVATLVPSFTCPHGLDVPRVATAWMLSIGKWPSSALWADCHALGCSSLARLPKSYSSMRAQVRLGYGLLPVCEVANSARPDSTSDLGERRERAASFNEVLGQVDAVEPRIM